MAALAGLAVPALAIPSPELVIGSLSSVSQVVALVTAMLGGGAAVAARTGWQRSSRVMLWSLLGFAALAIVSIGFNAYQWQDARNERSARLQATLLRPSRLPGQPTPDPTLKELSFSQQAGHPLGITTQEAARLLETARNASDVVILDIRETAETEMGAPPGSIAVRGPDLPMSHIDLKGKTTLMVCHNGNRSSENCIALAAKGIDCRFIIGGLEKWVVEKRPMSGLQDRTLDELRAIQSYPNQNTLLDTAQVHDLVRTDNVLFVDMRYPGEFATGHLPGAVNFPMRRMTTAAIKERIASLPRRPIVAPCYDRRSCFFGEVIGLELTRAGHDFRGRYTVPWEYFIPSGRPPHVEAWIAQSQRSLWDKALDHTTPTLATLARETGFPWAILFVALLSRLLILPLSLKAERDQIASRRLTAELDLLKSRLAADPPRRMRAIQAFYRRHGLTPGRNLLALLFLPIMTLAIASVHRLAGELPQALWWMESLDTRDETLLLPLLFGILIAIYLHVSLAETQRHRMIVWTLGLAAMTTAAALLSAAADIYLVASAALLLLQRTLITADLSFLAAPVRWLHRRRLQWGLPAGVVSLRDAERLAGAGNKAYRLARLQSAGIGVPAGIVLTAPFLERFATATQRQRRRTLDRLWRRLGRQPLAVRSSAAAEDGAVHSFAGVFDSELHVDRAGLEAAVGRVAASFTAERAASYDMAPSDGNIILQQMISARHAGVLFTRDPLSPAAALVEMVDGDADALVSGRALPGTFRFGRYSQTPLGGDAAAPIELSALLEVGRRAERMFGAPQDIEWTWTNDGFHIVQSRDITSLMSRDDDERLLQADWSRILGRGAGMAREAGADAILFQQNEMSEQLPRPTTLSLSLMEAMWSSGGSVDLACRRLGLGYRVDEEQASYLTTIAGRLYVDKIEARRRAPTVTRRSLVKLVRSVPAIERTFRETFLPTFIERMALLEAVDFDRMPTPRLVTEIGKLHDGFLHETHVAVDVVNIAAGIVVAQATQALGSRGLDAAHWLSGAPPTTIAAGIATAAALDGQRRIEALRDAAGHRAAFDYELSEPRYGEDEASLLALPGMIGAPHQRDDTGAVPLPDDLAGLVESARRLETLKEDAKHHSLRELALLRRAIVALDRRLGWDGLSFHLTFEELARLGEPESADLNRLAGERRLTRELWAGRRPPQASLTLPQLERAAAGTLASPLARGTLGGTRVAGSRRAVGRAVPVGDTEAERGLPIAGFEPGDIIVARMFHPAWLPYLRTAGGIVIQLGGWLSHMALLARERDVAMIVGVEDLSAISPGARIALETDGRIEVVPPDTAGVTSDAADDAATSGEAVERAAA